MGQWLWRRMGFALTYAGLNGGVRPPLLPPPLDYEGRLRVLIARRLGPGTTDTLNPSALGPSLFSPGGVAVNQRCRCWRVGQDAGFRG
jgi:hypothetical protein